VELSFIASKSREKKVGRLGFLTRKREREPVGTKASGKVVSHGFREKKGDPQTINKGQSGPRVLLGYRNAKREEFKPGGAFKTHFPGRV